MCVLDDENGFHDCELLTLGCRRGSGPVVENCLPRWPTRGTLPTTGEEPPAGRRSQSPPGLISLRLGEPLVCSAENH